MNRSGPAHGAFVRFMFGVCSVRMLPSAQSPALMMAARISRFAFSRRMRLDSFLASHL
jgi:hypothetical protein